MSDQLEHEIIGRPDFALVRVHLKEGEKVMAEPSAMASMDAGIELKAGFKGGFKKTIGRALGGESMIVNTFTAKTPGEVTFAPGPAGDMFHYRVENSTNLLLQRGAWVANSEGVEVSGKWQGMKGFFSGEGLVLLKASGEGDIFFNTFGAIIEVDVSDGYYVDTGFIVAFEDTLQYEVTALPGLGIGSKIKSFIFGGEGLVCRFSGQGKLWIQTRAINPYLSWVHPFRPTESSND
ncbi:TIGR00266 family protein [Myxococcota bacterium]|nr:TIGR00266 family protein [Myxococcota bacterium]